MSQSDHSNGKGKGPSFFKSGRASSRHALPEATGETRPDGTPLYKPTAEMQYIEKAERDYLFERAQSEHGKGALEVGVKRFTEDAGVSFKNAWKHPGKKHVFFAKCAGVGLGVIGFADGIYNGIAGGGEEVEDQFLSQRTSRNYVRMAVGVGEIAAGLGLIYYAGSYYGKLAEVTFNATKEAEKLVGHGV